LSRSLASCWASWGQRPSVHRFSPPTRGIDGRGVFHGARRIRIGVQPTRQAALAKEKRELRDNPEAELAELAALYQAKGISPDTARQVAQELTAHDALAAHLDTELGINPTELTSPWQAAAASAMSFTLGALLPLAAILIPPPAREVPITVIAVLTALALTATISARLSGANRRRVLVRVVGGGALGLAATCGIGHLLGTAVS